MDAVAESTNNAQKSGESTLIQYGVHSLYMELRVESIVQSAIL